jgi:hypothetical protein
MLVPLLLAAGVHRATAFEWQTSSPQDQGMDGAKLEAMRKSLADHHTTGLLVIRNDKIVCEWYQQGHGADKPHYTASMAKDAFWGSGAGHQILLVVPSLNLIAVRNGENLATAGAEPIQYHNPVRRYLFGPLAEAIR